MCLSLVYTVLSITTVNVGVEKFCFELFLSLKCNFTEFQYKILPKEHLWSNKIQYLIRVFWGSFSGNWSVVITWPQRHKRSSNQRWKTCQLTLVFVENLITSERGPRPACCRLSRTEGCFFRCVCLCLQAGPWWLWWSTWKMDLWTRFWGWVLQWSEKWCSRQQER